MAEPVIITVAITGAVPKKKDNPAVPVSPSEQVESTHQAYEAGASIDRGFGLTGRRLIKVRHCRTRGNPRRLRDGRGGVGRGRPDLRSGRRAGARLSRHWPRHRYTRRVYSYRRQTLGGRLRMWR
jgi:hypothetical protein